MPEITSRLSVALSDRYRIERRLGEGGMATVYLAEDLKHDRKVALKVLKPELAAVLGADRFVQEIKTTAGLQHPNILPLFDSGTVERPSGETEFLYYVMPFIEGETLRERLDRETQLGIDEAVKIASEVAEALDAAHHQGVIHRDIKPENILLHKGRPMVADFGIALAVSAAAGGRMTETGLSLGTPHYMSPEQATAEKDITLRSDVYSLGSVLYEMLTGEPPHSGASAQAVIMKIVTEPADPVTKIRKSVPPNVTAAVAKALEKLAADRFESAKAFADALTNPAYRLPTAVTGGAGTGGSRRPSITLVGLAIAFAAGFAVALGWSATRTTADSSQPVRRLPLGYDVDNDIGALAPNGEFHVFSALNVSGATQLWVRRWRNLEPTPIQGTEGAFGAVAISPDGREIAFSSGAPGPLLAAPIDGGPARTLVESQWAASTWGGDGMIYFTPALPNGGFGGVSRVPAAGGPVEPVTELRGGEVIHTSFRLLPNGRTGLFSVYYNIDGSGAEVWAVDLDDGERKRLALGQNPFYAHTGHVVFGTAEGYLIAAAFDAEALALVSPGDPVLENVRRAFLGMPLYTIAETGTMLYRSGGGGLSVPVLIDRRRGTTEPLREWRGASAPDFSPDGSRVALSRDGDIFVVRLDGGGTAQLTFGEGRNEVPHWSPDGRRVFFTSNRQSGAPDHFDVFSARADGGGQPQLEFDGEQSIFRARWSPDGQWLLLELGLDGPTVSDIFGLQDGSDGEPVPLITSRDFDFDPAVSPDGRWLAYGSPEGVVVVPFPNTADARWLVAPGGFEPLWSSDGTELYFATANAVGDSVTVHVAPVDTEGSFSLGTPTAISTYVAWPLQARLYTVAPGEQQMLVMEAESGTFGELILVQNFFEELKRKVGN
jgi:serine/threonine-protein kinase